MHLFPFSYTLIGSLSDDPGFAHPDWMFDFIDQVFMSSRTWSFLLFDSGIISFTPVVPFDSLYWTQCLFYSFIHLRSCVDIICIIAAILVYHSNYIACSGYFRLSVYT